MRALRHVLQTVAKQRAPRRQLKPPPAVTQPHRHRGRSLTLARSPRLGSTSPKISERLLPEACVGSERAVLLLFPFLSVLARRVSVAPPPDQNESKSTLRKMEGGGEDCTSKAQSPRNVRRPGQDGVIIIIIIIIFGNRHCVKSWHALRESSNTGSIFGPACLVEACDDRG